MTRGQLQAAIDNRFDSTVVLLDHIVVGFANFYEAKTGQYCSIGNVVVSPYTSLPKSPFCQIFTKMEPGNQWFKKPKIGKNDFSERALKYIMKKIAFVLFNAGYSKGPHGNYDAKNSCLKR